jgi:hypothetical protein
MNARALPLRFWRKVSLGDGCWEWRAARTKGGYGVYWDQGGLRYAHRLMAELRYGPIPAGHEPDHTCGNPACVRPSHLEIVSHRENTLRGTAPSARNARKTHCAHGHEFSPGNTYLNSWGRHCRECKRRRDRADSAKKRAHPLSLEQLT